MQSGSRGEPAAVQQTSRQRVGGAPIEGEPTEMVDFAGNGRAGIRALGHLSSRDQTHEHTLLDPCRVALAGFGSLARDGRGRRCIFAGRRLLATADCRNRLAAAGQGQFEFERVPRLRRGPCACQPV